MKATDITESLKTFKTDEAKSTTLKVCGDTSCNFNEKLSCNLGSVDNDKSHSCKQYSAK